MLPTVSLVAFLPLPVPLPPHPHPPPPLPCSVTKWVHLNRGDAGLQALFAAFAAALAPGGLLLLEPQPWPSYRAACGKVPRAAAPPGSFFHRLDELLLRPPQFADYLCEALGFRVVRRLAGVLGSAAGFDRPLLLLRKPA